MILAVRDEDYTAKDHVDGRGEQGRRDKEKHRLKHVRSESPLVIGGHGPANVADPLDWLQNMSFCQNIAFRVHFTYRNLQG